MKNCRKSNTNLKLTNGLLIIVILLIPGSIYAKYDNFPSGGRSAGLGRASVTLSGFEAIYNNQAGLVTCKRISAGFYYENHFLLNELSIKSGALIIPTLSGVFGLIISRFGFELYNESKICLAYAKSLGKNFSAGIQLDYIRAFIAENYGSKSIITFEAGFRAQLNKDLIIAAHINNPTAAKLSSYNDERIPAIFRVGTSYAFSKKVLAYLEIEKNINYSPNIKAGFEYQIIEKTFLRAGIGTKPFIYSFGFGLNYKKIRIDIASSVHNILGYSPQLSLIYGVN